MVEFWQVVMVVLIITGIFSALYIIWAIVDDFLARREEQRIAEYLQYFMPMIRKEFTAMSIETIASINDKVYHQFKEQGPS